MTAATDITEYRKRREYQRLASTHRRARIGATTDLERCLLAQWLEQVEAGELSPVDAQALCAAMQTEQQQRAA